MIIFQIIIIIIYLFFILGYSYILITPGILFGHTSIISYAKTLTQSFATMGLINNFKLGQTMQNIKKLINENTNKIDIIVCNHISIFDFYLLACYLKEFEIDSYNIVLKNELVYFPGLGYMIFANSNIRLYRNWDQDIKKLEKQLNTIKLNGKKQVILIFPEGTRISDQKIKEGQKFSKLNNLPVYENLLVPKSKGLWFIINKLSNTNKLGRIWDVTLILPKKLDYSNKLGKSIDDVNAIWREVVLDKNYKDLNIFKSWLINLWVTKDSLIKNHKKIIYNQIYPKLNVKLSEKINIVIILLGFFGLLMNKYGRYYLLCSFILSYILIFYNIL